MKVRRTLVLSSYLVDSTPFSKPTSKLLLCESLLFLFCSMFKTHISYILLVFVESVCISRMIDLGYISGLYFQDDILFLRLISLSQLNIVKKIINRNLHIS